jgi:CO/xanthine dehydrogenase Mo-binding subunit
MNGQNAVGSPVARKEEDLRLITGHGTYVSNLQLPRMRHVAFGRSPLAHARIRSVDATAARQVPGVRAVFTGHDPAFAAVVLRAQSALPSYVETAQPVLAVGVALGVAVDRLPITPSRQWELRSSGSRRGYPGLQAGEETPRHLPGNVSFIR